MNIKETIKKEFNLDFRRDRYAKNEFGAYPISRLKHCELMSLVDHAYRLLQEKGIDATYNTRMTVDSFKTSTIEFFLDELDLN